MSYDFKNTPPDSRTGFFEFSFEKYLTLDLFGFIHFAKDGLRDTPSPFL